MSDPGKSLVVAALSVLACGTSLWAQNVGEADLPRLLANEADRKRAISFVAASRAERVPLLLNLINAPLSDVNEHDFHVGLADAFGALKVTEAVPFLLRNITLPRNAIIYLAPWLKKAEVIEASFPAIGALILIGPDASKAAMQRYDQATTPDERLAIVFVVSRIRGVPEARSFLSKVSGRAELERYFAQEGMKP